MQFSVALSALVGTVGSWRNRLLLSVWPRQVPSCGWLPVCVVPSDVVGALTRLAHSQHAAHALPQTPRHASSSTRTGNTESAERDADHIPLFIE
eukprot:6180971-Pleurochrysis_carterae.AAC.2